MAALTTTRNGNWSDTGVGTTPWTALTGSGTGGVPGDGDTVITFHDINIDVDVTVGSGPATGGIIALEMSNTVTGKTVTVAAGVTLTLKGDIAVYSDYAGTSTLRLEAGSTLTFLPPSGQRYKIVQYYNSTVSIGGTAGSHATIKTDLSLGGLPAWTQSNLPSGYNQRWDGTYLDVVDMGGAVDTPGVWMNVQGSAVNCIMTDWTFRRSNFSGTFMYDGNFTLRAKFFDSVAQTIGGTTRYSAAIAFENTTGSGTRLIDNCGFDGGLWIKALSCTISNCFLGNLTFSASSSWSSDNQFANNVFYGDFGTGGSLYGPTKDCYQASTASTNPGYWRAAVAGANLTRHIFENTNPSNDGAGDCNATGDFAYAIRNCLAIPTHGTTTMPGTFLTVNSTGSSTAVTLEHNTGYISGQAFIQLGEVSDPNVGAVPVCKSNVAWSLAGSNNYLFWDLNSNGGSATQNAGTPAGFANNAGLSLSAAVASGTFANAANNCQGNFSTAPNLGMISLASSPFVDATRNFQTWGATKGTDGTVAAAATLLNANPAYIAEATTGLLAWVAAGFQVTGAQGLTLKDAGHDSVTIGAMGYVASGTGKRMDHRFLCPR